MRHIAVYMRVSTDDQKLENQRAAVYSWFDKQGIDPEPVLWFEDTASGKNTARPGLQRLLIAINNDRVSTVVVYKLDRLARDLYDGVKLLSSMTDRGVRVVSITQGIDLSGVMGSLIASVLFGLAELELDFIHERQRPGIERAKRDGKYKGRKSGTTKASPARARELQQRGFNVLEIAAALGVGEATVYRYLKNSQ